MFCLAAYFLALVIGILFVFIAFFGSFLSPTPMRAEARQGTPSTTLAITLRGNRVGAAGWGAYVCKGAGGNNRERVRKTKEIKK